MRVVEKEPKNRYIRTCICEYKLLQKEESKTMTEEGEGEKHMNKGEQI